jgi:hypothetical protein
MNIKLDKIVKELEKGSPDEQYAAFQEIKDFVQLSLANEQKILDEKSSELQSKIDRLNSN